MRFVDTVSSFVTRVRRRLNPHRQGFALAAVEDSATSMTQAFSALEALEASPPRSAQNPEEVKEEKRVKTDEEVNVSREELKDENPKSSTVLPPVKPPRTGGTLNRGDCTTLLSSMILEPPVETKKVRGGGVRLVRDVYPDEEYDRELMKQRVESDIESELGIRETGDIEDPTLPDVSSLSDDPWDTIEPSDCTQEEELITVGTTGAVMINESIHTTENIY